MKHIYCISGLGADERVFSKFVFPDHEIHFINWNIPFKNETIHDYALRLTLQIHHQNPILIGLSFGGMMCIEIAKHIPVEKIILISSVKTFREIPLWIRLSGKLKLNRIFPIRPFKLIEPLENYNLGIETEEELTMVTHYRKNIDTRYSNWAVDQLLNWKNDWLPQNVFQIHGTKDRLFPLKKIKADYIINTGGHFMIMNKSDKVAQYISSILKENIEQDAH